MVKGHCGSCPLHQPQLIMFVLSFSRSLALSLSLYQTSEPIEHLLLVPNLNLRRLIKDFLIEGGEELYVGGRDGDGDDKDDGSGEADRDQGDGGEIRREEGLGTGEHRECLFALVTEQILVLKVCLRRVHRLAKRGESVRRWRSRVRCLRRKGFGMSARSSDVRWVRQ